MYRPSRLSLAGLLVGLGQAAVFAVAVSRAYPSAIVPRGGFALLDAYGGLVVLSVVCAFVSIRYRLALPGLLALVAPVGAFLRERRAPPLDVDLVGGFVVIYTDANFLRDRPEAAVRTLERAFDHYPASERRNNPLARPVAIVVPLTDF